MSHKITAKSPAEILMNKPAEMIEEQTPDLRGQRESQRVSMDEEITSFVTRLMSYLKVAEAQGLNPNSFNSADFLLMKASEGCFCDVFICRDKKTRKEVAVKILKDTCEKEDIDREVSMLEEILRGNPSSKFTVRFLKRCEHDGQTCLVFERLEQTTKEMYQGQRGTLPRIRVFATQLLLALDELQAVNVLHGDLHPGNIMSVNRKYQPQCIKLIDFGSAIKASDAQPGMELQMLEYRAPEILLGLPFTEAIDVWGVGCTLAFLYLGHNLFSASSEDQIVKDIVDLLGQPEDHLLGSGKYTQHYFVEDEAADGPTWTLRKPGGQNNSTHQLSSLEDIFEVTGHWMKSYKEYEDIMAFVDLLKQLLHVDGNKRISAHQALKHLFITMNFEPQDGDHWFSEDIGECSEDVMAACPALSDYLKDKSANWTPFQNFSAVTTHLDQEGRNKLHSSSSSNTVLEKLGEDAYSYVVKCQNRTTKEEVAVKVPKVYGTTDLSARKLDDEATWGVECGRVEVSAMESYQDFCRQSLVTLQERGEFKKMTCEPLWSPEAPSVISFSGRAVLSPLLSAEQRSEMCEQRRRAVQLEVKRQSQQRINLLAQVEDILGQAQAHNAPSVEVEKLPKSKSATVSAFTLVTDSPGLPRDPVLGLDQPASPSSETSILRVCKAVEEVKVEREEKSEEEVEDDISSDSLLERSRGCVMRGRSQQGSKVVHTVTKTPRTETASAKVRRTSSVEFGCSLHRSPVASPQTQIHHQTLYDLNPQKSCCRSPGRPDQYARLPGPEASVSPCPQRRRPHRPVSPRSPGRSGEYLGMADKGDTLSRGTKSPDHSEVVVVRGGSRRSSHCCTSPLQETCSPVSASGCSPIGHHDHLSVGFRRRCHTLDSQPHSSDSGFNNVDRSQESVPCFMAGVIQMAPSRRRPADPIKQSYEADGPSPSLLRPRVTSDVAQVTLKMEPDDTQRTNNGRITSAAIRNAADAQASQTEENQRQVQGLEDMKERLKQEHAMQMSLLLAEKEKEQQSLRLELEETKRRLREQGCVQSSSGDAYGWKCRSASDRCPVLSPSYPGLSLARTPSELSLGQSFPHPVSSSVSSPSAQPPVYLSRPTRVVSKPRARLSLVLTTEHQRAFCRIGAMIRGFLTRRLLKTEKVKHLRKTVVDTQEFVRTFQTEATQKRGPVSAQDRSLVERVRAQLRAARYDIHRIFFEMPLGGRSALLQQERELQAERQLRVMEKAKSLKERLFLSAATQRSLDGKKRVSESLAHTRKMQQKPKSSTTNRSQTHQVLKPNQGQRSPQLNCQRSWYRRAPEERVRRSDSLRKQHSLG